MLLALDRRRRETPFEQTALPRMALVEALGICAGEKMHPGRQPLAGRLEDQVVVGAHDAARVEAPAEPVGDQVDERDELRPVQVAAVEQLAARRATGDMVEAVRQIGSTHPRHSDRR
jgi:hypothetical protein